MPALVRARRYTRFLTAVGAALVAMLLSGLVAFANVPVTQISTDPYTNASSQHQTEVEPDSFSNGATIVAAFQVGRFNDGGASNIGWSTSTNSGATWTNGFLPGTTTFATPPGTWGRVSDPSVAYDALHNVWLINYLPISAGGSVLGNAVSRSTDGGLTWMNPVNVVVQGGLDKNWMACDNSPVSPYYGHCYGEWDNNGAGNILQMSTSSDGGATWGTVRTPSGSPSGLGGQPVVLSNGTVVVPYSANGSAIRDFRSTDGGNTWTAVTTISSVSQHSNSGGLRTSALPSAEVDSGGRVFVAWQDCRFRSGCSSNDIVFSSSLDGVIWTAVTRVPIDATSSTVDHFIPGLAVDPFHADPVAHLGLTYYYYPVAACTSSTCQLNVGFTSSTDGGATWATATAVAGPMTLTWLALTNQGYMVGDYMSTSFTKDGKAHGIFAVATAPGAQFNEAMFTPIPGLSLQSILPTLGGQRTIRAGGEQPVFFGRGDRPPAKELPTAH